MESLKEQSWIVLQRTCLPRKKHQMYGPFTWDELTLSFKHFDLDTDMLWAAPWPQWRPLKCYEGVLLKSQERLALKKQIQAEGASLLKTGEKAKASAASSKASGAEFSALKSQDSCEVKNSPNKILEPEALVQRRTFKKFSSHPEISPPAVEAASQKESLYRSHRKAYLGEAEEIEFLNYVGLHSE